MERRLGNEAAGRAARTPLLLTDIRTLDTGASAEPPLAPDLPDLSTSAARIGARWVLDGSAHGGRAMLPHLQRTLAVSPDHGASYFASAGIDLKAERQSLRDLMERGVITEDTTPPPPKPPSPPSPRWSAGWTMSPHLHQHLEPWPVRL